jgi:hypothetical protein
LRLVNDLVLGDVAALQDEFADGEQEQEDKNGVEFGAEESVDHEQFSLSPAWFCGYHDLGGSQERRLNLFRYSTPPARNIYSQCSGQIPVLLMSIPSWQAFDRVLA